MHIPTLTTPRLVLRGPVMDDLAFVTDYEADPTVMRFIGDGLTRDGEHARNTLEGFIAEWERVGHGRWTVTLRRDGQAIGNCGFVRWRDGEPGARPELAYGFAQKHWSQGYATEAAHAAISWAWTALAAEELVALTQPANLASQRVLSKLGFRYRGPVTLPRGQMSFFTLPRDQQRP